MIHHSLDQGGDRVRRPRTLLLINAFTCWLMNLLPPRPALRAAATTDLRQRADLPRGRPGAARLPERAAVPAARQAAARAPVPIHPCPVGLQQAAALARACSSRRQSRCSPGCRRAFADRLRLLDHRRRCRVPPHARRCGAARWRGSAAKTATAARISRWFWGFRLYLLCAPDGLPVGFELAAANCAGCVSPSRLSCRARVLDHGQIVIGDKGFAGCRVRAARHRARRTLPAPRPQKRATTPRLTRRHPPMDRINLRHAQRPALARKRHGGRSLSGLISRIARRLLALTAVILHKWADRQPRPQTHRLRPLRNQSSSRAPWPCAMPAWFRQVLLAGRA